MITLEELDRELRELGQQLRIEPAPDLADAVRSRLQMPESARPRRRRRARNIALGVVAALLVGIPAAPAAARNRLLTWLHIPGVRLSTSSSPPPSPRPPTPDLGMGAPVSFGEAQRAVRFRIEQPTDLRLPRPTRVLLGYAAAGPAVTLVYPPARGIPRAPETGAGIVLSEFIGGFEKPVLRKILYAVHGAQETSVHGSPALWLPGPQSVMLIATGDADRYPFSQRPSANSLLWVSHGVTFRLEGAVSMDVALLIASTIA
jgi:hypothetical protein